MANTSPTIAALLNGTPEAFAAAYPYHLVAEKLNYDSAGNLAGALPDTLVPSRLTAEYANLIDDFIIECQSTKLRWFRSGTGSPEGVLTAPVGTVYVRTDGGAGTCLYVKESGTGNTGWIAVTTAGTGDFLPRNGSLPMTGSLDMNGEDVTNVAAMDVGFLSNDGGIQSSSDLEFTAAASRIILGLTATSGNAQIEFRKGGANNQSWGDWQSDAAAVWTGQHDTSENWNILDSSGAVALQIERGSATANRYVRGANGVRVGSTTSGVLLLPATGANTSDATVTTAATVTLADNSAVLIVAKIVAMQTDGSQRNVYVRRALVYRDGGGATLQGAVDADLTIESAAAWDCTIDVSGNDARVRVTGAAATSISWRGSLELITVV